MKKVLIANRGEIALRIMKTARKMGIRTVAVYSEADEIAPHTIFADEAVYLGKGPSTDSYLNMEKILEAAKNSGADAIHPGYGFFSENAEFAKKVKESDIIFIGPSPKSIEIMGSKLKAKAAVSKYNIPMVPGTDHAISDVNKATKIAEKIGLPILIKASAGGGGKGMRIVKETKELKSQLKRAASEALSSFGNGDVFIEKYIESPRHIEIQILADEHGNYRHLLERECSIQRRHQKIVEEAPSSVLDDLTRQKMGEAAIKVAKSCDYTGAGTVEFLLDSDLNFYFLEMNTRLQVEHPVTEMITGVDLVEEQIKVARGEVIDFHQDEIKANGHAIELRVYAEDSNNNFLPDIGLLTRHRIPEMDNVRIDSGYREGQEIPIYYDPMISKLIAWAPTRRKAITKLAEAIENYYIEGVATTLPFGKFVCENENFINGQYDTHFVEKYFDPKKLLNEDEIEAAALLGLFIYLESKQKLKIVNHQDDNWLKRKT